MKTLSLIALCMLTTQALANSSPESDVAVTQTTFVGQRVDLINDDGQCALARSDDSLLRLDVKWPCQFSQNFLGKTVLENYLSAQIFMVQHSEPSPTPETSCTTTLQAIRYYNGNLELAPIHTVTVCNTSRWDQKVFVWQFDW